MGIVEKSFIAKLPSLHAILDWLHLYLKKTSLSATKIGQVELALEEGVVNIISYAYKEKEGSIEVVFEHHKNHFIEITLKDTGIPFDPLKLKNKKKKPTPFSPIQELDEGGLGIFLMKKFMDTVKYIRQNNKNILVLRKNLS